MKTLLILSIDSGLNLVYHPPSKTFSELCCDYTDNNMSGYCYLDIYGGEFLICLNINEYDKLTEFRDKYIEDNIYYCDLKKDFCFNHSNAIVENYDDLINNYKKVLAIRKENNDVSCCCYDLLTSNEAEKFIQKISGLNLKSIPIDTEPYIYDDDIKQMSKNFIFVKTNILNLTHLENTKLEYEDEDHEEYHTFEYRKKHLVEITKQPCYFTDGVSIPFEHGGTYACYRAVCENTGIIYEGVLTGD